MSTPPIDVIVPRLRGARRAGAGWSARCPAHDDRHASLSVGVGEGGRVLLRCHAGCTTAAVVAALGLEMRDLFPGGDASAARSHRNGQAAHGGQTYPTMDAAVAALEWRHGPRSALWTYHDAGGRPVGAVARWECAGGGKIIRPVARHAGGWRIGAMPEPRPLYRLPELGAARRIIVTEGEKAADAARSLGLVATTSSGGAQAAPRTDWSPLAGCEVWVLPDNDAPGRRYAAAVADILTGLRPPATVRTVELPGLPDGGDIVDWVAARGGADPAALRVEVEALAAAAAPHTPDATGDAEDDDLSYRPFPVGALPSPVREFTEAAAAAIGCDPAYVALPLLVAAAAAIGNTRRLELKRGWWAPPIMWGAIVGESGTTKSPALRLVLRPLQRRQQQALERHATAARQHEAAVARWEAAHAAWRRSGGAGGPPPERPDPPRAERLIVSDTTVEALAPILAGAPRGVLLARDELAGWIGAFDRYASKGRVSADVAHWLSMYSAETVIIDRKTGDQRTICIPRAAVCVVGGIQPGILRRALSAAHREDGLAARLLVAHPPRRAKRWTEADIDPAAEAELGRILDRLYSLEFGHDDDGEPQPVMVRMDAAAKAAWVAYHDTHAAEQADMTGDLAAAWSKLEEYAARLALVIHFVRWAADDPTLADATVLDAASMTAGVTLARWFGHEARRAYAALSESDTEREQRQLVEWIARRGGEATAREVRQGCRWLRAAGAAEAALEELVRIGRGSWRDAPPTARGGRPARVFVLAAATAEPEGRPADAADAADGRADRPGPGGVGPFSGGPAAVGPYRERY